MFGAFLAGLGSGFLVGAQVGPIWLLCMRSALRGRFVVGLSIGAGAALIDMSYAALGVVGGAGVLRAEPGLRYALGVLGAAVLVVLGIRTIWSAMRIRAGMESAEEIASPGRAFVTAVVATASNPLTIASWAALFTATSSATLTKGASGAALLVLGVGLGSLAWFTILSAAVSAIRHRIGAKARRVIDLVSGAGLVVFGAFLGIATWRQS
ncbi:MAG: LysE family transporter [Actinomycetota bacterium]|nr:LysE family transporter [Actinomycetota bacterium]